MKWYGEPERIDADHRLNCEVHGKFELDELLDFAAIAANAAEHQLDSEEADAEFNAVLVDLDADDACFLVDLMFYRLIDDKASGTA